MNELLFLQDRINQVFAGLENFAAEMRAKGIHVGLGTPPVCVTCDQDWPCTHERRKR